MDSLSLSDNLEMTNEEEDTLLGEDNEDSMVVDSPATTAQSSQSSQRQKIVYDLGDSTAEEDNDRDESGRDKFKSERQTINLAALKETTRRNIPAAVDRSLDELRPRYTESPKLAKRQQRTRNRMKPFTRGTKQSTSLWRQSNSKPDLRQFINQSRVTGQPRVNPTLLMQGLGLTNAQHYQMKLGILNPLVAQNQLLVNALLAQSTNTPLLNRLQVGGQPLFPTNVGKKVDDIQITIQNTSPMPSTAKIQTKSKIRCLAKPSLSQSDSSDCVEVKNVPIVPSVPSAPTQTKLAKKSGFKTLFAKHLETKVKEKETSKGQPSSGGLFGDAFAEVEAGVDNDYMRKMEEMEQKRREILRRKEESRLAMADERLESANKLRERIGR